jgi:23S rRNA (cytidine1920-2'-O)/16S rRNA (cytidine1409-2'-O)-methyltransferase
VLDVGSSTGGFTDYALQHGARKVIAVDVGTDQLHPSLRGDTRIELHEKTDIRDFTQTYGTVRKKEIDLVVADVSFVSLRNILPSVALLTNAQTRLLIMMKPQFEAGKDQINKGVIKNSTIRRSIVKDFEHWLVSNSFIIHDKADSDVAGTKGNVERFYLLSVED